MKSATRQQTEDLLAQLTVHRQSLAIPGDLRMLAGENQPPPKGYFSLLDRPQPENRHRACRSDTVPRIIGQVLVYGKQTDREARAELIASRKNLGQARAALAAIAGKTIRPAAEEEVLSRYRVRDDALALDWYLPADIAPAERRQLLQAAIGSGCWSSGPSGRRNCFGGKTPREAAADPKMRIPAVGRDFELGAGQRPVDRFRFQRAARALGLPENAKIDPTGQSVLQIPLVRLARLEASQAKGRGFADRLRSGVASPLHARHHSAGTRIVGRASLDAEVDKGAVYAMLAQLAAEPAQAAADLDAGRRTAEAAGKSTARFDLIELAIHMGQGDLRAG